MTQCLCSVYSPCELADMVLIGIWHEPVHSLEVNSCHTCLPGVHGAVRFCSALPRAQLVLW